MLEQGYVPKGVDISPNTGNRLEFGPGAAFWLAIVIKLKQAGMTTPLAAEVAERVVFGLRTLTQNLGWDWTFLPMARLVRQRQPILSRRRGSAVHPPRHQC